MRRFLALAVLLVVALAGVAPAAAFEVVTAPEDVNAVDLKSAVDLAPGSNGKIQLSTAPGEDGIIRRVEVLASQNGTNPNWALFALKNDSDAQMDRLLVAPYFRLPGSGVFRPDLGALRITALTPSAGIRPVRLPDREADVYEITLDPGATVTFVAELAGDTKPELYLWKPDAYRDYVNSFTLFRGVVLGVAALAAVFLTIMFVVRGRGIFPTTAAFSWAVLVYLLVDFGVFGPLVGLSNGATAPFRAASEAGIATTLFAFLFVYLNLHRWHFRFITLALALTVVFLALFGFAFLQPAVASTISRLVLALLGLTGFFLILLLALRGYDRAVLLVPTWIIYIAWLFYGWLVITGQVSNDIAQPAVRLLDVALQQEGEFAMRIPARLRRRIERGQHLRGRAPPVLQRTRAQFGGQPRVAGEVPHVQQAQRDLHVLGRDLQRLRDGTHGVVEADLRVPDRVPEPVGEPGDLAYPCVQQYEVHIPVWRALAPAQAADGGQGDPWCRWQQSGEPGVERRRTRVACGGAHLGAARSSGHLRARRCRAHRCVPG